MATITALLLGGLANVAWADMPAPRPAAMLPLAPCVLVNDVALSPGGNLAVGEYGHVLRQQSKPATGSEPRCEAARHWQQQPSPVSVLLNTVSVVGDKAWAAGHDGVIMHSADGGASWDLQHRIVDEEFPVTFLASLFLNEQRGFVVGAYSAFAQTVNGGKEWIYRILDKELEGHLHAITRLRDSTLVVVGADGTIYSSTDEGLSWQWDEDFPYEGSLFTVLPWKSSGLVTAGLLGQVWLKPDRNEGEWQSMESDSRRSFFAAAELEGDRFVLGDAAGQLWLLDAEAGQLQPVSEPRFGAVTDLLVSGDHLMIAGPNGVQTLPISAIAESIKSPATASGER